MTANVCLVGESGIRDRDEVERLQAAGVKEVFFFLSSRRRHTIFSRDWSSDVCSSDLEQRCRSVARPCDLDEHFAPSPHDAPRSEERRVGKECRSRWSPDHYKKKKRLNANDLAHSMTQDTKQRLDNLLDVS